MESTTAHGLDSTCNKIGNSVLVVHLLENFLTVDLTDHYEVGTL